MHGFADDRNDVFLANCWPLYPAPAECARCGGRLHRRGRRTDAWCPACLAEEAASPGAAGTEWRWREAS
jgi:hypothetical protein